MTSTKVKEELADFILDDNDSRLKPVVKTHKRPTHYLIVKYDVSARRLRLARVFFAKILNSQEFSLGYIDFVALRLYGNLNEILCRNIGRLYKDEIVKLVYCVRLKGWVVRPLDKGDLLFAERLNNESNSIYSPIEERKQNEKQNNHYSTEYAYAWL